MRNLFPKKLPEPPALPALDVVFQPHGEGHTPHRLTDAMRAGVKACGWDNTPLPGLKGMCVYPAGTTSNVEWNLGFSFAKVRILYHHGSKVYINRSLATVFTPEPREATALELELGERRLRALANPMGYIERMMAHIIQEGSANLATFGSGLSGIVTGRISGRNPNTQRMPRMWVDTEAPMGGAVLGAVHDSVVIGMDPAAPDRERNHHQFIHLDNYSILDDSFNDAAAEIAEEIDQAATRMLSIPGHIIGATEGMGEQVQPRLSEHMFMNLRNMVDEAYSVGYLREPREQPNDELRDIDPPEIVPLPTLTPITIKRIDHASPFIRDGPLT